MSKYAGYLTEVKQYTGIKFMYAHRGLYEIYWTYEQNGLINVFFFVDVPCLTFCDKPRCYCIQSRFAINEALRKIIMRS